MDQAEKKVDAHKETPEPIHTPSKKRKYILRTCLIVVAVFVLLFAGLTAWVYTGSMTNAKTKFVSAIPYPAAIVGNHFVSMKDYIHRYTVAQQFYPPGQSPDEANLKKQILDQLISETKLQYVSAERNVTVSDKELSDEYAAAVSEVNQAGADQFPAMLKKYGITEQEFKQQILKPNLLMTNLGIWFNSQENLNQSAYKKIHDIQDQLKNSTTTFESLVKGASEDENTNQLEGDLGFVDVNAVLPEFKEALDTGKPGDITLLVSRYGLHLIKVVEKDNGGTGGSPRVHIKQIYVKTGDFNKWFADVTSHIRVKKLAKT